MKQLFTMLLVAAIAACNQSTEKTKSATTVNVDSLTNEFLAGWNNKDSAAIMKSIAANAVVMNDSSIFTGHTAIANKWISGGVKVLSNIVTTAAVKGSDAAIAYSGGTYTLDLTPPGGPLLKEKGNYSLVWAKQENGQWLLTLVHIEDVSRMPDIKQ